MGSHRRIISLIGIVAFFLIGQLPGFTGAQAAPLAEQQCFSETNQCIEEPFLTYWREHGGLAINGYPITNAFFQTLENGKEYTVQYFERVRLELHPENVAPYNILLGQFGRLLYLTDPAQPRGTRANPLAGTTYFDATGHNLAGSFRSYWEANGGLAQFGYPISEVFSETLENGVPYSVQYFERARFELHPENAAPYDVLLGQFGRRVIGAFNADTPLPYVVSGVRGRLYRENFDVRVRLGIPSAPESQEGGVFQLFERGGMIYRESTRTIYVFATDVGTFQPLGKWLRFADTWSEGQEIGGGVAPAPNLFLPKRGFGKVWREHPEVQQLLGYALNEDEQSRPLVSQQFAGGLLLNVRNVPNGTDYRGLGIYLFYSNGRFEFRYGAGE